MERLDKVISNQTNYSRKDIKNLIKNKRIKINNEIIYKSDIKINKDKDIITIDNKILDIKKNIYLILNKPACYISATEDKSNKTVLDLISPNYLYKNLFPVGRLDKDTTGLLILTDDGNFTHNILSPKKHIKKTYKVVIDIEITDEMITEFKKGVILNDGICKSSILEKIDKNTGIVTLTEGRYHQIKRMFGCFKAKVLELERIGMGNYKLPQNLKQGEYRELTKEELDKIKEFI